MSPKWILFDNSKRKPKINPIAIGPNKSGSSMYLCKGFSNFKIQLILSSTSPRSIPMSYSRGGYSSLNTVLLDPNESPCLMKMVSSPS